MDTGKLGVSLAGGGFRASLFHLGVLRRLAELDILRRVEVLSTVSGGSITGALYVLLLKKYLERTQPNAAGDVILSRADYIALVDELEQILVRGVQQNLRTRLLMNPFGLLLVMLSGDSLGRRMGRLYERYLLQHVVNDLKDVPEPPWWRPSRLWPGQIRMRDLAIRPGGNRITDGLAAYNARQREIGGSVITGWIANATSLNTGGRFFFSAVELGDFYLGYFRESEFDLLLARKMLLGAPDRTLEEITRGAAPPAVPLPERDGKASSARFYEWEDDEAKRASELILRQRNGQRDDRWNALFAVPEFPGLLNDAAPGLLRRAKTAAWYIREGSRRNPPVMGGVTLDVHVRQMWSALATIDPDIKMHLEALVARNAAMLDTIADYILELYWQQGAARVSHRIHGHWHETRVGHAVGSSACFPPVFPPFLLFGVYDDLYVPRLGLTDGGVYDNMGVTALLDEGCDEIIASDTGGLFNLTPSAASGHVGLATRIPDLLMRALGGAQKEGLRERARVSRKLAELTAQVDALPPELRENIESFHSERALDALVYFHMSSPRVEPTEPEDMAGVTPALPDIGVEPLDVARLRTDLDGFGDVEVAALVNHGYDITDRYVRRYALNLVSDEYHDDAPRMPRAFAGPNAEPARAKQILEIGSQRFMRALKLRLVLPWIFTVAAAAAIVWGVWRSQLTVDGILNALGSLARSQVAFLDAIARLLSGPGATASRSPMLLTLIAGVVAGLFLLSAWKPIRRAAPTVSSKSATRLFVTARKWVRAVSGNILWLLLGLPAIIAGAVSAIAWIVHIVYYHPFKRAVRIDARAATPAAARRDVEREVPAGGA
jgi:predicted acylesterase/phospholipase RssA